MSHTQVSWTAIKGILKQQKSGSNIYRTSTQGLARDYVPGMDHELAENTKLLANQLTIVSAKDYVPGKEHELLEGIQNLLFSSMEILSQNISTAADQASGWFWNATQAASGDTKTKSTATEAPGGYSSEEKKCDDEIKSTKSGDWTPNELDGIVDSMGYVLEVMETYQEKAHKAAKEFLEEQRKKEETEKITCKVDKATANKEGSNNWNLQEMAKEMSTADFLFGSLMPNHSTDEYPEGSEPIYPVSSSSPATDVFLGSLSSLFGVSSPERKVDNGNLLTMDSKLQYLHDIQTVNEACTNQIQELDTILGTHRMESAWAVDRVDSMTTNNSVVTCDVEDQAAQTQLGEEAASYIQAARDKLAEYSCLAESLLKDQIKCILSEYTCADQKCGETTSDTAKDGPYFEALRKHFNSDVYNMDFKTYLMAESDDDMQMKLLNTLHSSMFLRNVGDKCQNQVRVHVGMELSVTLCNIVMGSILADKKGADHRITEWGALLFSRHVRALHAYVYEFCRCSTGYTEDILIKVESSSLDAPPMDANWERLFSAVNILKLERLADYEPGLLHPLYTINDARRILRLRTDFDDDAINRVLSATANDVDTTNLLGWDKIVDFEDLVDWLNDWFLLMAGSQKYKNAYLDVLTWPIIFVLK